MKKLLCILLLLPALTKAQRYTRAEIKHAADSLLRTFVREDMFVRCQSDLVNESIIAYSYTNKKGKICWGDIPEQVNTRTKGRFLSTTIRYTMIYPYPKCPICDVVKGRIYINLTRWLEMGKAPDITFIPDYVWENDTCKPGTPITFR
jgi:hypothetical protein